MAGGGGGVQSRDSEASRKRLQRRHFLLTNRSAPLPTHPLFLLVVFVFVFLGGEGASGDVSHQPRARVD